MARSMALCVVQSCFDFPNLNGILLSRSQRSISAGRAYPVQSDSCCWFTRFDISVVVLRCGLPDFVCNMCYQGEFAL